MNVLRNYFINMEKYANETEASRNKIKMIQSIDDKMSQPIRLSAFRNFKLNAKI